MIDLKPIFFFAFTLNRDFKQEQMQIRLNLVVALAAAQIAFLSGIDALEPKVRLHYSVNWISCLWQKGVAFVCLLFVS